jgi:hypothetical protein
MIDAALLRFFTRLSLGRGRARVVIIGLLTIGVAAAAVLARSMFTLRDWASPGHPGLLGLGFGFIVFAGGLPAARVLELEAAGYLDHLRLCARPAAATVGALIAGSAWPYLVPAAAILTANVLLAGGAAGSCLVAVFVFVAALDLALMMAIARLRTPPPIAPAEAFAVRPFFLYLAAVAMPALLRLRWPVGDHVTRAELIAFGAAALLLPYMLWRLARRIERPIAPREAKTLRLAADFLARRVPRNGPAELVRQLRSSIVMMSGANLIVLPQVLLAASVVMARRLKIPAPETRAMLMAIPVVLTGASGIAVLARVKQDIQNQSLELALLTPQRREGIALGYFAGLAIPFWVAGLCAAATSMAIDPSIASNTAFWTLMSMAVLFSPAVGLADGLAPRVTEAAFVLTCLTLMLTAFGATFFVREPMHWAKGLPWNLRAAAVIPAAATAALVGIAIGRLQRREGPPLAGGAAVAAIVTLLLMLRLSPGGAFPRLLIGALVLWSPFFSEDRRRPERTWLRIAIGSAAAAAGTALIGSTIGISGASVTMMAAAAALAFATGVLMYEALPIKYFAVPLAMIVAIAIDRPTLEAALVPFRDLLPKPAAPPEIALRDLALVAAAFLLASAAHALAARRAARAAA